MKKTILLSLLFFSLAIKGQKKTKAFTSVPLNKTSATTSTLYGFSTFTAPYQEITGTSLSNGKKWDELVYKVPPGFNFNLYNQSNDTIFFIGGSFAAFNNPLTNSQLTVASPMFEDLCDRAFFPPADSENDPGGISPISYTVSGTAGNRICIIQVKNAGFFEENSANDSSTSVVNLQLWLYETSQAIEFRYGTVDIKNPSINLTNPSGFLCGMAEHLNVNAATALNSDVLSGPYNNPVKTTLNGTSNVVTGQIESGRVYRFERINSNTNNVGIKKNAELTGPWFYPNPANNTLYVNTALLQLENPGIAFYDLTGKLILSAQLKQQMDLSTFKKGIYFVTIKSSGQTIYSSKLVIAE